MHYWKPADKATLKGRHHYCTMILVNANICVSESFKLSYNSNKTLLKTNESKWRTYRLNHMSAWLKLNPISVVPFLVIDWSHLGWSSSLRYPILFLRMALFFEISCWSHISDYHTVLNPYNLTSWQLTPLHRTEVLSWMAIFHFVFNENNFSVLFERHTLLKSHDIILRASLHWHYKCHYKNLERVVVMITWSWKHRHWEKDHFWTKLYHVTSVANNVANPFIFYMSMLHDMSPW